MTKEKEALGGFDIAAFDIATPSDEGRPMALRGGDGKVIRDEKGEPVTITLRGIHSQVAIDCERMITKRLREHTQAGTLDPEEFAEWSLVEMLSALTVSWTFGAMDGKPFPCSLENARKFWGDRRFRHFRAQADDFVRKQGNFMKG